MRTESTPVMAVNQTPTHSHPRGKRFQNQAEFSELQRLPGPTAKLKFSPLNQLNEVLSKAHSPRACDPVASETLFRRHYDLVFRVCLKHLRHREEAREAAQETFLKAIKALPEFQGLSQTSTWIYRIAVNECLSRIESRRRDREKRERLSDEMRTWEDQSNSGEAFAGRIVKQLLHNVNPATRNIVWLSLGQGLTHAEIASTLGVSRVAVTRRITRFLRQARNHSIANPEREVEWREAA